MWLQAVNSAMGEEQGLDAAAFLLHELVAAFGEILDLGPVELANRTQRDPSMLADVGSPKEAFILEEDWLRGLPDFKGHAQLPLVLLQNAEGFLRYLERRMAESGGFGRVGESKANLAQLIENLISGRRHTFSFSPKRASSAGGSLHFSL